MLADEAMHMLRMVFKKPSPATGCMLPPSLITMHANPRFYPAYSMALTWPKLPKITGSTKTTWETR